MMIFLLIFIVLIIGFFAFVDGNMTYDRKSLRLIQAAHMIEKQFKLEDRTVINYGEGPDNGPALLLIHGQQVSWQDYANVLGTLSKKYHVFAVDCYGHCKSSKNIAKYSALANGQDVILFIKQVIKQPVLLSGHSSGGLLATWVAANEPDLVKGVLIEDAPFFSTESGRAQSTFAWLGFKDMHDFLTSGQKNYTRYFLDHTYLEHAFGKENFYKIVKKPALNYLKKHPNKIPRIWYYPPFLGVNTIYDLTANLQDGTGDYDLRFGVTFYDFSWLQDFNQEEALKKVQCPSTFLHTAPPSHLKGYYDDKGILLSAMDDKDAKRVHELLKDNVLIDKLKSGHDIHQDLPDIFVKAIDDLAKRNK